jgi:O-methyltransferase
MILAIDVIQSISIILIVIFFILGFKLLETNWSYKITKPYLWEEGLKDGSVSQKLKNIERSYRDKVRFYTIWLQIKRLKAEKIKGAFAELGVYKGETARIIHETDYERKFYLFDTFKGFDEQDLQLENRIDKKYSTENFADTNINSVKKFIDGNDNLIFIPGYFPESAADVKEEKYAFVHLDADLYKPTLAALNYFYPKLSPGGVILIHDYNHTWPGLRKAVDEFLLTIPESPVEIADSYGSVMILRNRFSH